MRGKKFLAIFMAVMMIFVMCSCASADSGESDKKEPVSTSAEETEKETSKEAAAETSEAAEETAEEKTQEEVADDEENELGLTGSEMKEIYAEIEKALQEEYLDVNGIKVEDFSIPEDSINWEYFAKYCIIVYEEPDISEDRLQNLLIEMYPLSSENQNIMKIISSSFYNALEELDLTITVTYFPFSTDVIKNLIISNVFADTTEEVITE